LADVLGPHDFGVGAATPEVHFVQVSRTPALTRPATRLFGRRPEAPKREIAVGRAVAAQRVYRDLATSCDLNAKWFSAAVEDDSNHNFDVAA
jgi:hypothetical protein